MVNSKALMITQNVAGEPPMGLSTRSRKGLIKSLAEFSASHSNWR